MRRMRGRLLLGATSLTEPVLLTVPAGSWPGGGSTQSRPLQMPAAPVHYRLLCNILLERVPLHDAPHPPPSLPVHSLFLPRLPNLCTATLLGRASASLRPQFCSLFHCMPLSLCLIHAAPMRTKDQRESLGVPRLPLSGRPSRVSLFVPGRHAGQFVRVHSSKRISKQRGGGSWAPMDRIRVWAVKRTP